MSKYTTELRFICENYAGKEHSEGYNNVASIIESARSKVFDFDYPIFDESYRNALETKILKHYYLREICTETVGIWKLFLNSRMNEIMPYYNKLYESELIEFNPLYDTDLTKDYNKDGQGTGSFSDVISETVNRDIVKSGGNTETNTGTVGRIGSNDTDKSISGSESDVKKNKRWDIYSDTPQGGLTNIENETYLTNARKIVDDGTGSTKTISSTENSDTDYSETETRNLTNQVTLNEREDDDSTKNSTTTRNRNLRDIEDYIEHIRGKSGGTSNSKLLQEFRDTFLNIDVMIINDLNDLFFGLW